MPESAADPESAVNPYITPKDDKTNAGRLKPDVAHQLYNDIRQEAKRQGLGEQALKELFDQKSRDDLPDYQATQIVDLEEKATRDSLTGLLNRREFNRLFRQSLQQADESGQPILFLMIDLDYFKNINDTYGHAVGDQVLKYLARALTDSVDIDDLVARWGGEEFVIAIKPKIGQSADPNKLLMVADRIRVSVIGLLSEDQYQLKPGAAEEKLPDSNRITLSVGATLSKPRDTIDTVCQRADENLYKAKNGGRDQSISDNGEIDLTPVVLPDVRPETVSN